jgi:signal transduction histidine kinase
LFDADQARVRQFFENRRAGISEQADIRFRARDGQEVWTIMSARPLSDDRGEFRGALDLFTDTTERKQAEEALRKSEEFRRRVLDSTRDCVKVLALDGSILSMNHAGLDALEIDELGSLHHTSWIEQWQLEEQDSARRAIEAARAGGVGRFQGYLPTRKTLTPKWWDVVITPILDSQKQPVQLLVVSRDVTDHRRMEVALRDADRRKDEFLAMLAHELRNPISAINSAAELSQHPQISEQDLRWSQEIIQRQVKHLSRLVDDLLDVSRIIHGKIELRHELLDAETIIEQAIESIRPLIDQREHHFELVMPPVDLPIMGDATRVEQIIVNLLTNAAKYTPAGGHIRLAAEKSGSHLIIKICDTGVGIPPDKISEMFDLFSQGDRSLARSEGGLGIGLTLVKRLTEMHGGTVAAHSEGTGNGSEFVVRLPLAQKASLAGATQAAADEAPGREAISPCAIR